MLVIKCWNFLKFYENVKSKMFKVCICSNFIKLIKLEFFEFVFLIMNCVVYFDGVCIGFFIGVCIYLVYLV